MINDHPFRLKWKRVGTRSWKFVKHRFILSPMGFGSKWNAKAYIMDHKGVIEYRIVPKPAGGWGRKR